MMNSVLDYLDSFAIPESEWEKELEWIEKHYAEEDTPYKLAVRFQKEVSPKRELAAITARIYAYAKKENLKKN